MNVLGKKEMLYDIKHLLLDSFLYSLLDASRKWFYSSITVMQLLPGAVASLWSWHVLPAIWTIPPSPPAPRLKIFSQDLIPLPSKC